MYLKNVIFPPFSILNPYSSTPINMDFIAFHTWTLLTLNECYQTKLSF